MSRSRHLGPMTESFNLRWHSVANPATPSVDIMSSPDPLNDPSTPTIPDPITSSATRRVTRSQRSQRFLSLGSSGMKPTLEMNTGSESEDLLPTIEYGDQTTETRRRLFPTSSPQVPSSRRRPQPPRATTTTVPLNDFDDDTSDALAPSASPDRRGRIRTSNGTPIPRAGTKRRAGTPIRRTPRRITDNPASSQEPEYVSNQLTVEETPTPKRRSRTPRKATPIARFEEDSVSEAGSQATPTPRRSGRTRRNPGEPSSELGTEMTQQTTIGSTLRTGRKRRQALAPDELIEFADEIAESAAFADVVLSPRRDVQNNNDDNDAEANLFDVDNLESDIWMTTLSNEATPRASTRNQSNADRASLTPKSSKPVGSSVGQIPSPQQDIDTFPEDDYAQEDYGYLAPADSDASSVDDHVVTSGARDMDTIAQGEDFSMIFMDSIPSLQVDMNSSAHPTTYSEIGEETSIIINNTLESLRQEAERGVAEPTIQPSPPPPPHQHHHHHPSASPSPSPSQPVPNVLSPPKSTTQRKSSSSQTPSASPIKPLIRSPKKAAVASSPLRHQVLKNRAFEAADSAEAYIQPVVPADLPSSLHRNAENLISYEDSFSEIPQEILIAATPKRPVFNLEADLENDILDQDIQDLVEDDDLDQYLAEDGLHFDDGNMEELQDDYVAETIGNDNEFEAEYLEEDVVEQDVANVEQDEDEDEQNEDEQDEDDEQQDEDDENDVEDAEDNVEELQYQQTEDIPGSMIHGSEEYDDNDDSNREIEEEEEALFVSNESVSGESEVSKPPTPEKTPPQAHMVESLPHSMRSLRQESTITSPLRSMNLSNPLGNITVHQPSQPSLQQQQRQSVSRSASSVDATPLNQISSPLQDPRSLVQEHPQDRAMRPPFTLSATLRAGRVLQSVTSDPPSPDAGDRHLRSPFRSSGGKDSRHGSKERSYNDRWPSKSPTRPLTYGAAAPTIPVQETQPDLNRVSPKSIESPMAAEISASQEQDKEVVQSASPRAASETSSVRQSLHSDGIMSWIAQEGPISPRLRGDNSLQDAYGTPTKRQAPQLHVESSPKPVDGTEEDNDDESIQEKLPTQRDDETDIWDFEAKRATPRPTRQQPFGLRSPSRTSRNRDGMPSPWTRSGRQPSAIASFGPTASTSTSAPLLPIGSAINRPTAQQIYTADGEEYSLLSRRQAADEAEKGNSSAVKASRFDLSSFFSSPAAIPGILAEKFFPNKANKAISESQEQAEDSSHTATINLQTSSMFPQLAQAEPKQTQRRPVRSSVTTATSHSQPVNLTIESSASTSPEAPEMTPLPPIPQRQSFTPQTREASSIVHQPSSAPVAAAMTPPRMQLSHDDIRKWQQETSSTSEDSSDFVRPYLRPLPPKNASPRKSSLRSPLKPRTPGRVVEFTSSVLSPMEQARSRQERQAASLGISHYTNSLLRPSEQQGYLDHDVDDKENQDSSDVSMSDAPQPTRTVAVPVSQTSWTRQHWLFLDWLLQQRREGPFEVDYEHSAEKYLGKTVRSQGEAMTLERWHLDCVDAFIAEVGDWDEGILAKRLCALILGEERRRRESSRRSPPDLWFN